MNFRTPENLRIFWSSFFVCSWTEFVLFCRTKENQKGRRCPQGMKAPVGLLSRRPVCEANAACSARQGRSDFDALDPRIKGCSPLIIPKEKSKRKNASRFAKRIFFRFSDLKAPQPLRRQLPAGEPAPADAVCRYDPSREKAKKKSPQAFLFRKLKIIFPLKMHRVKRRAF